ncbi:putative F-box protein At3g49980 [Silene latifolia]|uniref:putative F-box protein At3g49980 n=1 Tax=Silene latifolia TaxID=37657 RepID=UPI003D76F5E8
MVEGYFERLSCEILQNIALMLPFSSIIQLKYTSKFWYNLLTHSKFVDLHLTHALQKQPGYLFAALPKSWPIDGLLVNQACYFAEESGGQLSTSKMFEYSFDRYEPEGWVTFQSSGGLMCAYASESSYFRIFNPHIAEEVQIPRDPKFKRWRFLHFVFSYSPSIKVYKILKIGELYCGSPVAEICTLGSNIWRVVQNVPSNFWRIGDLIQCQGNPFWMEKSDLHFFDIVSEKFHVIPGPPVVDRVPVTHSSGTHVYYLSTSLISMGDTVGYVDDNTLWVLEDKTKGIWINKYEFSIPSAMYICATLIGTLECGHLFGYKKYPANVFSHDMGCTGFRVKEVNLDEHGEEEDTKSIEYMTPHVRSFVSPVRIMKEYEKDDKGEDS